MCEHSDNEQTILDLARFIAESIREVGRLSRENDELREKLSDALHEKTTASVLLVGRKGLPTRPGWYYAMCRERQEAPWITRSCYYNGSRWAKSEDPTLRSLQVLCWCELLSFLDDSGSLEKDTHTESCHA